MALWFISSFNRKGRKENAKYVRAYRERIYASPTSMMVQDIYPELTRFWKSIIEILQKIRFPMRYIRLIYIIFLLLFLFGCSLKNFNQNFEKDFYNKPLMQTAIYPNMGIPTFSWADYGSEGRSTGTDISNASGSCPTWP